MSLSTCPPAHSQHPHEHPLMAFLLCGTHILNLSLLYLLHSVSRLLQIPSAPGLKVSPLKLFCYDPWLHFQATICTCSLNDSCFQQMKHPSAGQPGLGDYPEMIYVNGFPPENTLTQRKDAGPLLHCGFGINFCSTKVPQCFSHEKLLRCKDPSFFV